MSLYQDIRGALTTRANTTTGLPASKAYEGLAFDPVIGTAYVAYSLIPTLERPASVGLDGLTLRQGLFQVSLFYPSGSGTGTAESKADDVKSKFVPGTYLTQNTTTVRIRYAERGQCQIEPDWIMVPVTVGWDLHTPTNS
jgi:hypothetical protein